MRFLAGKNGRRARRQNHDFAALSLYLGTTMLILAAVAYESIHRLIQKTWLVSLVFRHDYSGSRNERIPLWKSIRLFLRPL